KEPIMAYTPPTSFILSNSQTLSGNNATVATNIFQITGMVEVLRLWAVITTVLGSNHTAAAWRLYDGTTQSDITLSTGSTLSSFSAGGGFWKRGLSTTAVTVINPTQERVNDPTATSVMDWTPVILTQKTGSVATYIQYVYTTTNTPTSGVLQHWLEWRP